jgi:hypothetical protein
VCHSCVHNTMNDNDNDEMDMFASLGGSLMKDLLADLAVDDDDTAQWFSLAQLEKELKQMEQTSGNMDGMTDHNNTVNTAAGMVVQNQMAVAQQAFGNAAYSYPSMTSSDTAAQMHQQQPLLYHPASLSTLDAWSSTLANAATLQDFLQADTARKSSTAATTSGLAPPPGLSNASFRPYDVNESVTLEPPPGLVPDASRHVLAQTAVRLQELQLVQEEVVSKSPRSKSKLTTGGATTTDAATTLVQQLTLGLEQIREERALDEDYEASGSGNAAAAAAVATDSPAAGETDGMRTPPLKSVTSDRFRSIPKPSPVTPQNSIAFSMPASSSSRMVAPTPQPTPVTIKTVQETAMDAPLLNDVMTIVPSLAPARADQAAASTTGSVPTTTLAPIPEPYSDVEPLPMPSPPPPVHQSVGMAAPMDGSSSSMVAAPMVAPLLGVPVSSQAGPAWQMPPPPPPTRTRPIYANPHPAAAPVPATALASRFMTARDISYVVHSMLKPILVAETAGAMSTYHIAYWMRHHPVKPPQPPRRPHTEKALTTSDILSVETDARRQKAKEWSTERKVLGPTAKANVARPRALLSLSKAMDVSDAVVTDDEHDSTNRQQQRAALWKSRIYCDQAYQCLAAVIDAWQKQSHSASENQNGGGAAIMVGAPSASVQPHLVKLTKCLGVSIQTVVADATTLARNQYNVDRNVLQLLLRLPKGKVLLARVLEQALLPPAMVSALLPTALSVLMATPSVSSSSSYHGEPDDAAVAWADDRVFAAWTVVLQRLADLPGSAVIAAVQAIVQASSNEDSGGGSSALSSTARMQCTHALLQRGSAMSSADVVFAKEWATTEASFMNLLAGL